MCKFFFKVFGGHMSFLGGHWYPCFGFLVMSSLGFKARVGSALFAFCGGECNVHSSRSTSGATCANLLTAGTASHFPTCISNHPHMHVQRWDLARIRTGKKLIFTYFNLLFLLLRSMSHIKVNVTHQNQCQIKAVFKSRSL